MKSLDDFPSDRKSQSMSRATRASWVYFIQSIKNMFDIFLLNSDSSILDTKTIFRDDDVDLSILRCEFLCIRDDIPDSREKKFWIDFSDNFALFDVVNTSIIRSDSRLDQFGYIFFLRIFYVVSCEK